jgi:hypothetical protein
MSIKHLIRIILGRDFTGQVQDVMSFYGGIVRKGDLVFDIGAYEGVYSLAF